jgi:hypothetical protein
MNGSSPDNRVVIYDEAGLRPQFMDGSPSAYTMSDKASNFYFYLASGTLSRIGEVVAEDPVSEGTEQWPKITFDPDVD